MRVKALNFNIKKLLNGNTELTFEINDKQNKFANQISSEKTFKDTQLELQIEKFYNKRSLGHNKLFWDMCGYLSEHINDPLITPKIIYRQLISDYGVSTIMPVEDDMLDMVVSAWEKKGDGYLTHVLRKSKLDGNFTNVKFWVGSSEYNSKQMWRLVEGLKQMCRENDLDISMYDSQFQSLIKDMEANEIEEKHSSMRNKKIG